ncbi:hypothetical protein MHYP_G00171690 [Metynnis hypsauchen]
MSSFAFISRDPPFHQPCAPWPCLTDGPLRSTAPAGPYSPLRTSPPPPFLFMPGLLLLSQDPLSLSLRLFGGSWFRCLGYRVEIREASQQWTGKHDQYRRELGQCG